MLNGTPAIAKEDRSAIPVTMPGSAIGSSTTNEIASRPKNRVRYTAAARRLPITSAINVAIDATVTDSRKRRPQARIRQRHLEPLES